MILNLIENTCAFIQKRANTSCEGRAAVGLELQLPLRSPRACHHPIHTSIRPPARMSVTQRAPPDWLSCFSVALRRCCQASGTPLMYMNLFQGVGVSVFVYGLLKIISLKRADSNTMPTPKLTLPLSVSVCASIRFFMRSNIFLVKLFL